MTRSEKVEIIAKLEEGFKASEAIVVCNYRGLSTKKLEELRNNARENNVKVQIVKNTLANIALNNSGKTGLVLKD
ncbi:50S ribosomal protein L10, partial [Escherichia coli]|nr:50S ribosomal protein L10 [Escherichia coli]